MPNIGVPEILILLLVALIVFGPRKLPELGKSLGQGLREFRKTTGAVTDELRQGLDAGPVVVAPVPTLPSTDAVVRTVIRPDVAVPEQKDPSRG